MLGARQAPVAAAPRDRKPDRARERRRLHRRRPAAAATPRRGHRWNQGGGGQRRREGGVDRNDAARIRWCQGIRGGGSRSRCEAGRCRYGDQGRRRLRRCRRRCDGVRRGGGRAGICPAGPRSEARAASACRDRPAVEPRGAQAAGRNRERRARQPGRRRRRDELAPTGPSGSAACSTASDACAGGASRRGAGLATAGSGIRSDCCFGARAESRTGAERLERRVGRLDRRERVWTMSDPRPPCGRDWRRPR